MRPSTHRRRRGLLAGIAVLCLALAGASSAGAEIFKGPLHKEDFLRFINCPLTAGKLCTYGETTAGEFKIGSHSVPIKNPVILQGGLEAEGLGVYPLIPPVFGAEMVSKTKQTVPGGLTGLSEEVGGPVYATAEPAGPILLRPVALGFGEHTAIQFPIKVHLENELLGANCYIGSDAEPIVLHLTDGTTEPPAGTEPIKGNIGKVEGPDKGKITEFNGNKLVDNGWAAPAATGCGTNSLTELVTTELVNTAEGLPSAAGKNVAILEGTLFTAFSSDVAKYDKKALKEKEPKKSKK
jgi:hypothetical protein